MENSIRRGKEKRENILTGTSAIDISLPNSDTGDYKLEVILSFDIGKSILVILFSTV